MTREDPVHKFHKIVLVAFGGPSSSGKTTSSAAVKALFKHSILVHLDDFYLPDSQIPIDPVTKLENWDCPEAINFEGFIEYIKNLKQGKGLSKKLDSLEAKVDLKLTEEEEQHFTKKIKTNIPDADKTLFVLIDGFMLFHDPRLMELFDVSLFFRASFETLKDRRESRKGYSTVEGFWVDPPHYFEKIVWPAFVSSHSYLFENEDVSSNLIPLKKQQYRIHDIKNDNGNTLYDLVDWSLDSVIEEIK
ncbi:uridine kinase activity protein [Scheffersomyces coipomensis]|uniref:uridine kinase activity protein n=1 Tax=Scheffersomyces coipomensis TaxID=1788519 RepID=UPI00315C7AAB